MRVFQNILWLALTVLLAVSGLARAAGEAVLVTSVQGAITVEGIGSAKTALEPFVRLKEGDKLTLTAGSQANLLFVSGGRMETWRGAGMVQVGETESKATSGKPELQTRQIPAEVARQMNRTPSTTQEGRVGMLRMRAIPKLDAVNRLERDYADLRGKAAAGDITPEIFLLAGLYDLRQYARLEEELKRVSEAYPQDPSVAALRQLYTKATAKPEAATTEAPKAEPQK